MESKFRVIKRSGLVVPFDKDKIYNAVMKTMKAQNLISEEVAEKVMDETVKVLQSEEKKEISVEHIQNIVEDMLRQYADWRLTKAYIIYRAQRTELRDIKEQYGLEDDLKLGLNSISLLEKRYLRTVVGTSSGDVKETPSEMFKRVAHVVANAERKYGNKPGTWAKIFYDLMANQVFMPSTPVLANAGSKELAMFACYVLPLEDSIESIGQAIKDSMLIEKGGGAVGFTFSKLRPSNDVVKSTEGVASGPISFMKIFDVAADIIKQGGIRRGGNMGLLRCDHPNIFDFITCKKDETVLTNFNISTALTKPFMDAVKTDGNFDLINPRSKEIVRTIKAKELFYEIAKGAWENGEPGVFFIDRVNEYNTLPKQPLEAVNLCGEQPLLPYEACCLGSINLAKFVEDKNIIYQSLEKVVRHSIRFLDNIIDVSVYTLPEIREVCRNNRKIGLGVMGFADMLFKMEVPYNSKEAQDIAREIMRFINVTAKNESEALAAERGSFLKFSESTFTTPTRNASWTTIAPTGSISIISECSSGIEPIFGVVFVKENILGGRSFIDINPIFEEVAKREGFYSETLITKIIRNEGKVTGIDEVPEKWQKVFVTALEISPKDHVDIQAAFQENVTNSISKTCNLPSSATIEDVAELIMYAYDNGCKGLTIYRNESRNKQVLRGKQICPECSAPMIFSDGCVKCSSCYYMACTL